MNKQIIIERVFDAPVEKVWQTWTEAETVKKWWGPKDFTAPSIKIDFRVGGKYIYCMRGPQGSQWDKDMYSAGIFKEITPMKKIVVTDYFSDEYGNKVAPQTQGMSPDTPDEMDVTVTFESVEEEKTKLSIIYNFETDASYEAMKKSGMEEGWSTSLDKMADVLASL